MWILKKFTFLLFMICEMWFFVTIHTFLKTAEID